MSDEIEIPQWSFGGVLVKKGEEAQVEAAVPEEVAVENLQPYDLKCDDCGKVLGTTDRLTMSGHLCEECGDAEHAARALKAEKLNIERLALQKTLHLSDESMAKLFPN